MVKRRSFVKKILAFTLCVAMASTSTGMLGMTAMASEVVAESTVETDEKWVIEEKTVKEESVEKDEITKVATEAIETKIVSEETMTEVATEATEIASETTTDNVTDEIITEVISEETIDNATEIVTEDITETTTEVAIEEIEILTNELVEAEVISTEEIDIALEVCEMSEEELIVHLGEGNPMPELSEGYTVTFLDEFDGKELNLDNWNREQRQPGWTNNELQEYTDSDDNSYVAAGKLVLQALKTKDANGNDYYTSGKVTTKDKVKFTYGKIEASMRMPSGGQGMWPAFWMMPQNEQFYGTWPKCGEIDIMEVLGHEPEKAYQTLP